MTLDELAAVKSADPVLTGTCGLYLHRLNRLHRNSTERVLRLLAGIGYVVEDDVRVYSANAITREMSTRLSAATLRYMYYPIPHGIYTRH